VKVAFPGAQNQDLVWDLHQLRFSWGEFAIHCSQIHCRELRLLNFTPKSLFYNCSPGLSCLRRIFH